MRSNSLLQLGANDHTRTLGGRATREQHDARTSLAVAEFKQASGNAQGDTGAPQRALVVGNGPGIPLQLLERGGQLELALRDGQEEACVDVAHGHLRSAGLLGHVRSGSGLPETKHVVDLLCGVVLAAAEDVRLGAFSVAKLVYLGLELSALRLDKLM
jgi:hypothetical protein